MNLPCTSTALKALLFLALLGTSLRAEDWTTTDGKIYQDVLVKKVDLDALTIIYRDGGALIPLWKLPLEIQLRYDYRPDKAQQAADSRALADAESAKALQAEAEQAAKYKAALQAEQEAARRVAIAIVTAATSSTGSFGLDLANPARFVPPDPNAFAKPGHPITDFDSSNFNNGDILDKPVAPTGNP